MRRKGEIVTHAQPRVIRYADDFVILHRYLDVIEKAKELAETWLQTMGLELKPSKTRLTHTLHPHEGNVGFNFLGFTIRQFPVGKTHQRTVSGGRIKLTSKTLIKPSRQAVERHYRQIAEVITTHSNAPQEAVIARLNPIVRGWCGYYRTAVSKTTFSKLDHLVTRKLLWWTKRRHRKQSLKKAVARYWHMERAQRRWIFGTKTGMDLLQYADTPIERHIKVEGTRTPFDGDWAYWAKRMGNIPCSRRGLPNCSNDRRVNARGVACTSKTMTCGKLTIFSPDNSAGKTPTRTFNFYTRTAMTEKAGTNEVSMSRTIPLRSRVRRKSHARF